MATPHHAIKVAIAEANRENLTGLSEEGRLDPFKTA